MKKNKERNNVCVRRG